METKKITRKKPLNTKKEIMVNDIWNKDKMTKLREFILSESKKQSPERKLRNEILAIKYQIQDYIESDIIEKEMKPLDFVKMYLKVLKINKKDLASAFEMRDSNLHKYLTGQRRLNPDIVLKLSSFSHTKPEIWYYVQTKNELFELRKEGKDLTRYKKYDFSNIVKRHKTLVK